MGSECAVHGFMGQAVGFGLDSAEGENHQEMVGLGDLSGSGVAAGLEVARRSLRPAHPSAQSSMQDACLDISVCWAVGSSRNRQAMSLP